MSALYGPDKDGEQKPDTDGEPVGDLGVGEEAPAPNPEKQPDETEQEMKV